MRKLWRINDIVAVVLLAIVTLAPLPLGSNRPVFWMLSASVVFTTAGIFLLGIGLCKRTFPVPLRGLWIPISLGVVYLAFMALQAINALPSVAPNASILATLRTLSYAVFFFLVLQVAHNPKRASWMIEVVLYSALLYALIGFFARYSIIQLPEIMLSGDQQSGAKSTFVNRNSLATYLGFGLLTGIALMARRINTLRGTQPGVLIGADYRLAIYFVAALVIFVTLLATNSRMGVAAVFCALGLYILIPLGKRAKMGRRAALTGVVVIICALGIAVYLYGTALLDRFGSIEHDVDVRFALYQQVWDMIMARPWVGHGADGFELAFQKYHKLPVSNDLIWDKAHNSYLTNWAESGFIFGSIPILLLALAFAVFLRCISSQRQRFFMPLLGMSVILQSALHSLVDFSLEIQANVYVFLAIVAIALADALRDSPREERNR